LAWWRQEWRTKQVNELTPQKLKIHFEYSRLFDEQCRAFGGEFERSDMAKLFDFLPQIQNAWNRNGTKLLDALVRLTGQPFRYQDLICTLFLNQAFENTSLPFLLNVEFLMKDFNDTNLQKFTGLVFHELLHTYLADLKVGKRSEYLRDHDGLAKRAKTHVHLFSCESKVYSSLDLQNELTAIRKFEEGHGAEYKEAWSIVDKNEDVLWNEIINSPS
jgi:hypothetical protein